MPPLFAPISAPDGALTEMPYGELSGVGAITVEGLPPGMSVRSATEVRNAAMSGRSSIDGAALNGIHAEWRAAVYAEFPSAQTVDAMTRNEKDRTSRFVSIGAYVERRKVVALFVAEAHDVAYCTQPKNVQVTARTLPEPTDPEALPEPFRSLAISAFAQ